jgi:hypothetical protein
MLSPRTPEVRDRERRGGRLHERGVPTAHTARGGDPARQPQSRGNRPARGFHPRVFRSKATPTRWSDCECIPFHSGAAESDRVECRDEGPDTYPVDGEDSQGLCHVRGSTFSHTASVAAFVTGFLARRGCCSGDRVECAIGVARRGTRTRRDVLMACSDVRLEGCDSEGPDPRGAVSRTRMLGALDISIGDSWSEALSPHWRPPF